MRKHTARKGGMPINKNNIKIFHFMIKSTYLFGGKTDVVNRGKY